MVERNQQIKTNVIEGKPLEQVTHVTLYWMICYVWIYYGRDQILSTKSNCV